MYMYTSIYIFLFCFFYLLLFFFKNEKIPFEARCFKCGEIN